MKSSWRISFPLVLGGLIVGGWFGESVMAQGTFAGLSFIEGSGLEEISAEYWQVDEWIPGDPAPSSTIAPSSFNGSSTEAIASGSAAAELGILRARATGTSSAPIVLSVAGFTDTITLFAEGQVGEPGTLHLEYELDGTVFVKAGSFGSVSLDLLNQDLPELETLDDPAALEGADTYDSHAEVFSDFVTFSDLSQTFEKGVNPLVVTLDIPISFGTPINYGAALFLLMYGEGDLDFSQTLEFTDATVSDSEGLMISEVGIASSAGLNYGAFNAVPEPSAAMLVLAALAIAGTRRRR